MRSALVQAYEQEARKPYGYVLIDRRTVTPYQHSIRRNIFEELLCEEPRKEQQQQQLMEDDRKEEAPKVQEIQEPIMEKKEKIWLEWKTSNRY